MGNIDRRQIKATRRNRNARNCGRGGFASLDTILVLGVILPLVLFLVVVVPRMIQLVYEMTIVLVGSPLT